MCRMRRSDRSGAVHAIRYMFEFQTLHPRHCVRSSSRATSTSRRRGGPTCPSRRLRDRSADRRRTLVVGGRSAAVVQASAEPRRTRVLRPRRRWSSASASPSTSPPPTTSSTGSRASSSPPRSGVAATSARLRIRSSARRVALMSPSMSCFFDRRGAYAPSAVRTPLDPRSTYATAPAESMQCDRHVRRPRTSGSSTSSSGYVPPRRKYLSTRSRRTTRGGTSRRLRYCRWEAVPTFEASRHCRARSCRRTCCTDRGARSITYFEVASRRSNTSVPSSSRIEIYRLTSSAAFS